ncbi:hypothetical protein Poli38472_011523 [Pythium oligandrum]|uniref:Myb-like domain-containing protein n=1 Tax=Pythium oligandrum TaxID=41045 RepID=A0A8K1CLQ2_PYTOL|nr:hypothetical protein Poli38472_011523 [Pythium oligandrum]|eukprot:TMW64643.1 hypothetical protein Poli38472_011523 [Pythium oligandrum]
MSTPTSMTMASPLHTAQSSGFMPSMSPGTVYSTAHAVWTPQELQLLQKGLGEFPDEQYDNVTRYIKIAATIPGKCVRDVAFKVKTLATDQIPERDHNFAKRMRIDHTAEMTKMPTDDMLDDDQLNDLLQDNVLALNTMRTNLLNGKGGENKDMMIQFRDNCQTLMSAIGDICGTLPPLPVKPDTSLIPGDISSGLQN